MTQEELASIIRDSMCEQMFSKPGAVLFSSLDTIKKSRVYIMGLNPGGNSEKITVKIIEAEAPKSGTSAYTHECWNKTCGNKSNCEHITGVDCGPLAEKDLARHQKNVIKLSKLLGYDTPAEIPSANAIFARSKGLESIKKESGFSAWDWWKACWPVHQHLLELIRPAVIITLGYGLKTSPLGFLAHEMGGSTPKRIGDRNRCGGRQIVGSIRLVTSKLPICIIGIPHPSYYAPGPQLASDLKELILNEQLWRN